MLNRKIKGKALFVFSDPGGAKPCLALSDSILEINRNVISDRDYTFYKMFDSAVNLYKKIDGLDSYINKIQPDIIFTGTSYTSLIEKEVIKIAKSKLIRVISFVDHYTSISARFLYKNDLPVFPDEVWVIDSKAKQIAIKEGVPSSILFVSGNPYHNWLQKWKPKISRKSFYNQLGLVETKKYVVFAPDPLSNINGIENYNFDEFIASKKIIQYVENSSKEFKENYHFLIKSHPNQSIPEFKKIFQNNKNFTFLPADINVNENLFFSDIVIGFFSSILKEAVIMKKPVIRFIEDSYKNDPFRDINIGVVSNNNLISDIVKYTNI